MIKRVSIGPFTIYALVDSSDPIEIRYVGQTANATSRSRDHLSGKSHTAKVRKWVSQTTPRVQFVVLHVVDTQELADSYERKWIEFAKLNHCRLLNAVACGRVSAQRKRIQAHSVLR